MEIEQIKKYLGQRIILILKSNFKYTGVISELHDSSLTFLDKYNFEILVSYDEISVIAPARDLEVDDVE